MAYRLFQMGQGVDMDSYEWYKGMAKVGMIQLFSSVI